MDIIAQFSHVLIFQAMACKNARQFFIHLPCVFRPAGNFFKVLFAFRRIITINGNIARTIAFGKKEKPACQIKIFNSENMHSMLKFGNFFIDFFRIQLIPYGMGDTAFFKPYRKNIVS